MLIERKPGLALLIRSIVCAMKGHETVRVWCPTDEKLHNYCTRCAGWRK